MIKARSPNEFTGEKVNIQKVISELPDVENKSHLVGNSQLIIPHAPNPIKANTMNLDNAVAAHAQWKTKFRMAITNKETLDAATIGKDNCCELGKWIHGAGKLQLGTKPEFTKLLESHKAFHVEAGKVAAAINGKKFDDAGKMIDASTPFASTSGSVGVAILALKKVMG